MIHVMWMIVAINMLCEEVTSWPVPSTACPSVSIYDICLTTDLHQIEELKNALFTDLNSSLTDFDENASSMPFGLLEDDWNRLRNLANKIPEGSALKSKVVVVFRILIAALHEAYGLTLDQADEQDNNIVGDEQENSLGDEEKSSSNGMDFGESNTYNVFVYDPNVNNQSTAIQIGSHKVIGTSDAIDEKSEVLKLLNNKNSNGSPSSSDTPTNILLNFEPETTLKASYNIVDEIKDDYAERNRKDSGESGDESINVENKLFSNPFVGQTVSQESVGEVEKNLGEGDVNRDSDESKENDTSGSAEIVNETYVEGVTNNTATERSHLPHTHNAISSESSSTIDHTTLANSVNLENQRSDIGDDVIEPHINVPSSYIQPITTTQLSIDTAEPLVNPELIKLVIENEKTNVEDDAHYSFQHTFIFSSSTRGPWENDEKVGDVIGSDSNTNELFLPEMREESKPKDIIGSDETNESLHKSSDYNLNDYSHESNYIRGWQPDKSNTVDASIKIDSANDELTSTNSNAVSKSFQKPHVTALYDIITTVSYTNENIRINGNVVNNIDEVYEDAKKVPIVNVNNTIHPDMIQSNTGSSQTNNDLNSKFDSSSVNTYNPHSNNGAQINTIRSLDVNDLSPHGGLQTFSGYQTSLMAENGSTTSTHEGSSFFNPVEITTKSLENTMYIEEDLSKHFTSEEDADKQSIERDAFSENNSNDAVEQYVPLESSEHEESDNVNLQSTSLERNYFSPISDDVAINAVQDQSDNAEIMLSVENGRFQSGAEEKDELGSTSSDGAGLSEQLSPDSSDHILSKEIGHSQSSSVEITVFSPESNKEPSFSENPPLESIERMSNTEKDSFEISTVEKNISDSPNSDGTCPHETVVPETPEQNNISKEMDNSPISSVEIPVLSPENNEKSSSAENPLFDTSERTSIPEKSDLQSGVETKVFTITNDDRVRPTTVQYSPKSSEETPSMEKENLQSSAEERDRLVSAGVDDAITTAKILPGSQNPSFTTEINNVQTSSVEIGIFGSKNNNKSNFSDNDNDKSDSVERNVWNPAIDDQSSAVHPLLDSSDYTSRVENERSKISNEKESGLGSTNNDDTGFASVEDNSMKPSTGFKGSRDGPNEDQPVSRQDSELVSHALPTQPYNELKIYRSHNYPYKLFNVLPRRGCQNGNDCVRVQHFEYKSNDDSYPSRLEKRAQSGYEADIRKISEIKERMSTYLLTEPEQMIWQDKVRHLKK